jgi:hypothetical protein
MKIRSSTTTAVPNAGPSDYPTHRHNDGSPDPVPGSAARLRQSVPAWPAGSTTSSPPCARTPGDFEHATITAPYGCGMHILTGPGDLRPTKSSPSAYRTKTEHLRRRCPTERNARRNATSIQGSERLSPRAAANNWPVAAFDVGAGGGRVSLRRAPAASGPPVRHHSDLPPVGPTPAASGREDELAHPWAWIWT